MFLKPSIQRLGATAILLAASQVFGQFEINWHTVDGGGVMNSTDGQPGGFELSDTIGQSDASPGAPGMTGGGFELTGGFWFARVPGDCNNDGGVDLLDYADLRACLTGPGGGSGGSGCACFDFDADGDTDLRDFAEFQTLFGL
jgi:hypothetical protein